MSARETRTCTLRSAPLRERRFRKEPETRSCWPEPLRGLRESWRTGCACVCVCVCERERESLLLQCKKEEGERVEKILEGAR